MYNFVLDSSFHRPSFGIEKDNFVEMVGQGQPIGVHLNLKGNKQVGGNIFVEDILKLAGSNLAECTLLFDNFLSCATYLIASPAQGKTTSADATSWETCSKQDFSRYNGPCAAPQKGGKSYPMSPSMVILSHTFAAETLFANQCLRSVAELIRLIATDGSALSGQSCPSGSCPWRQICSAESCTLVTCVWRRCMMLEVGSGQDGVSPGQVDLSWPSKVIIVMTSNMHPEMLHLSFCKVQVALNKVVFNKVADAFVKIEC
ncbi:hypothetical protein C8F01DRAFT_1090666 [Mycena amicta]|nr:hypothetical protein C8F01DRAFT_1090666 [Mycena amicta]